jgi:hypothetical protein
MRAGGTTPTLRFSDKVQLNQCIDLFAPPRRRDPNGVPRPGLKLAAESGQSWCFLFGHLFDYILSDMINN